MIKACGIKDNRAFTMMELMVAIILIGIMAGYVLPNFDKAADKARERDAIIQLQAIYAANAMYKERNGQYLQGSFDGSELNSNLSLYLIENGMDFSYLSCGTSYRARADVTNGNFQVLIREWPVNPTGPANRNPCCANTSCPTLGRCQDWAFGCG